MTLYHASPADNIPSILFDGLLPSGDTSIYRYRRASDVEGVYGFVAIEDARNFALDNGWYGAGIVAFESDGLDVVGDPEYDEGVAYIAIPSVGNIRAALAEIVEW